MKRKRLPKKERNILGPRLRQAREKAELSQEEAVALLEDKHGLVIHRPALSNIESQQRSIDDYEIQALASVYDVSAAWLFGEE